MEGEKKNDPRVGFAHPRHDAEDSRRLRHSLDHQHAWEYRFIGKMAEKLRLVGGGVLVVGGASVPALNLRRRTLRSSCRRPLPARPCARPSSFRGTTASRAWRAFRPNVRREA